MLLPGSAKGHDLGAHCVQRGLTNQMPQLSLASIIPDLQLIKLGLVGSLFAHLTPTYRRPTHGASIR